MERHTTAIEAIRARTAVLGVVGVGYVGLPLSLAFADAGFHVHAYDRATGPVAALRRGALPFAQDEPGLAELLERTLASGRFVPSDDALSLAGADIFIVAVDTPLDPGGQPATRNLEAAVDSIARHARAGATLVVESTVAPGTIRRSVIERFKAATGLRVGTDAFVIHAPERQRAGATLRNLAQMSRVIGGDGAASNEIGRELYATIVRGRIDVVDYATAELAKTAENAARDVQIALTNQIALACDAAGVDIEKVRELVNDVWRDQPIVLEPGLGAGGHCLPKDSWLLVSQLEPADRSLVAGARALNEQMVPHVLGRVAALLGGSLGPGTTLALLGTSYKADADDERSSRALALGAALEATGAAVRYHDPVVRSRQGDLDGVLRGADAVVLCVGHRAYRQLDPVDLLRRAGVTRVFDAIRAWDHERLRAAGVVYEALGRRSAGRRLASRSVQG